MSGLIVNADDLGYTDGVDRAVLGLHAAAALSSATAMASGASTSLHAADWHAAGLSIGAHVVLLDGSPTSPTEHVRSLVHGGTFRPKLGKFAFDLLLGRLRESEIEAEASAQIASLQALGLHLTHVDTHKHTHMFMGVLRPLLRAARANKILAVRNPFEPAWSVAATVGAPMVRRAEVRLLATLRSRFLREVHAMGMRTTAGALGVLATGTLNSATIDSLLAALARNGRPEDCYELVCHPAFHDDALDRLPTRLRAQREVERAALLEIIPRWTSQGTNPGSAGNPTRHRLTTFAHL